MSVNGRFAGLGRSDLLAVADRFQVPGASRLIAEVADAVDHWGEFATGAGLSGALVDDIRSTYPSLD
jgi:serine/threonine-protein kinase HipA